MHLYKLLLLAAAMMMAPPNIGLQGKWAVAAVDSDNTPESPSQFQDDFFRTRFENTPIEQINLSKHLTQAEQAWLANHRDIRLGVDPAWAPFEFIDDSGAYHGIVSDIIQILNRQLQIEMRPASGLNWSEVMRAVKTGQIDVLPCVVKTPDRSEHLLFTKPYIKFPMVILTRTDAPFIENIENFTHLKVMVVKNYAPHEIIQQDYPELELHLAGTIDEALKALHKKKVDAFVGNLASITYAIQKLNLGQLKVASTTPYRFELSFAVRKDWPELIPILNKSISAIPGGIRTKILNDWINIRFERHIDWQLVGKIVAMVIITAGFVLIVILRWNRSLAREIGERKKAERNMRKLWRAIEEGSTAIMITDRNGRIENVNPRFSEITGFCPEEAVGQTWNIIESNQHSPVFYQEIDETINAGREWRGEIKLQHKSGNIYWSSTIISPVRDEDDRITHFISGLDDITEQKRMDAELRQAKQAADQASQAKSEFLANMSHEIRTPMNAIIGLTHLALKTELNSKQHDYLSKIKSSADALLMIINDILDFSKIEAGKMTMESVVFDLEEVLENLSNLITVKTQGKDHLEVLYNVKRNVPRSLVGDPLRLGQVLINLGSNAVKFTQSGEIIISIAVEQDQGDQVLLKFSVSDTGIGMTPEQKDQLFKAFTQADTSTTRKFGGTGLGLTISQRLVAMMEGEIWAESQPEQGSTFYFTAAFGRGTATDHDSPRYAAAIQKAPILMVDDNETARQIFQEMLSASCLELETAASGQEALDKLKQAAAEAPFKVVLMDWKMPRMDGLEAARRIKNHPWLHPPPGCDHGHPFRS